MSGAAFPAAIHLGAGNRVVVSLDASAARLPPETAEGRSLELVTDPDGQAFLRIDGTAETETVPPEAADWLRGCGGVAAIAEMRGGRLASLSLATVLQH